MVQRRGDRDDTPTTAASSPGNTHDAPGPVRQRQRTCLSQWQWQRPAASHDAVSPEARQHGEEEPCPLARSVRQAGTRAPANVMHLNAFII